MKKILLIVFAICFICIGCDSGKEKPKEEPYNYPEEKISDLKDGYKSIKKVVAIKYTIAGRICYDVTDYKDNVYDAMTNMKFIEKHNRYTTDNTLIFDFVLDDKTISFEFNDGSYVANSKEMYTLEKTNYEIKYDKEIGCENYEKE